MTVRMLVGSCLCGAVRYAVPDDFAYAMNCHCSQCRRATGAAFKPFAGLPRANLTVTEGAARIVTRGDGPDAHDAHCGACFSLLWSVPRGGAWAHVTLGTLGTLIDAPSMGPQRHIFVGSKAPWHAILDDLPQHDGFP